MFTFNPNERYQMPGFFGPRQFPKASGRYHHVTSIVVSYLTDREQLARYLPAPFEVGELPIVTVAYACNKEVDWLAGRSYNLLGVHAAVTFKGEKDQLEGALTLVMWENLTDPILTGREVQGIPKIYADIPDHQVIDGVWRVNASHYANRIVEMEVRDLRPPTTEETAAFEEATKGKDNWMGWKYIPNPDGVGPALSHATLFPAENEISEIRVGQGTVSWDRLTWEQNPTQFHIVNALADLPNLGTVYTAVSKGSTDLAPPDRAPRILK
ncbi:acetoacetate decarboxylase family protein [bacterium]|nr:acetoacetate decarboxylase family protein [bacterium]